MRVLFVSKDLAGADLCYRLKKEGHQIKLFIKDKTRRQCLRGMVKQTKNWRRELKWVGKDGLIVFDCVGYGKAQDNLRKAGYSVVGGSYLGDKIENIRQYGQKIFSQYGLKVVPSGSFGSLKEVHDFLNNNEGPWVVKQNGQRDKTLNFIGSLENDNSDVKEAIKFFKLNGNGNGNEKKKNHPFDLQKKQEGVEIGIARYFNGNDWVGPIEHNVEHKRLFNGNIGPSVDEMGTLMWYDENEKGKLYQETLAKLKPFLQKANFRGDFDINFIVNKDKIYPLEATARFGCPSTQLQAEIHLSPWGEFLKAIADGKKYNLKYKKGFAVIALVAVPPYPYRVKNGSSFSKKIKINFKNDLTEREKKSIHFEEVFYNKKIDAYYTASSYGYILHVSGMGDTIQKARENVYNLISKISIPKMFFRTDIGLKFARVDYKKLKKWGWI